MTTLNVGDTGPEFIVDEVDRASFVRYAGASGDFNPIHWNEGFAKSAGYPGVFAQGMWTAGVLATFLTNWVGESNVRRFRTRFVGQVWPGEKLVCAGTVTSVGEGTAEIELSVTNAEGEKKIAGDATVLL
jgi:peroxisomal enoyl-CoA hydratase 2